ncbi:hypothetical protein N825_01145 [Skermanella stibiiresistens SB22]|uniref:UDP-glucose 6-dehydrogenase n=1 Tax=Skermanella stibiiresistens SB22 TaxID=1385369 RepID=W9HFZ4_9PROT|nr:nucleotide sugar dehydrogenase [Skermanella stibiiresistens]EWY42828.1 hypothetical protein N825_01145 [Skermanella stibiiresistens SB22]
MRICVFGLWHLGSVTAACLAQAGFDTVGLDLDPATVAGLSAGRPPLFEPGLEALVSAGLGAGTLSFTTDAAAAVSDADFIWVTHDTPVDDEDRADVDYVRTRVAGLFPHLKDGAVVLISSQMPVGSTRGLKTTFEQAAGGRRVAFAYSPENLRLGKAIEVFTQPERIILGVDPDHARTVIEPVAARFCDNLIWLSVESAEMVKHAINAFLATCVTFINEVATVCERVGADAFEVEAGMRSEPRIGPKAYVRPGGAFAGGTLARDVTFLNELASEHGLILPLLGGVLPSNQQHRNWALRRITDHFGDLTGRTVALLGLTYKPGTDTLRRSAAVELCRGLAERGAKVRAFDPAVHDLPPDLHPVVALAASADDVVEGADALVIATEWPEFKSLGVASVVARMREAVILDQNGFLPRDFATDVRIHYATIGKP